MTKRGHEFIVSLVLALYIIAAVAFECTANTARISTIGIYLVFVIGSIYLIFTGQFHINEHCICMLLLLVYIYIMSLFNRNALSDTVAYYYFTCTVLCLISYNLYISIDREKISTVCLLAFILGSLILAIRIIFSYGGFSAMIEFASSGVHERRVGGEFLNENTFGLYMVNAFFCCLVLFGRLKTKWYLLSISLLLISPLFVVMLLLSASKKAILYLLFGFVILILFFFHKYQGGRKVFILLTTIAGIAFIYYIIMNMPAFRSVRLRFIDLFNFLEDNSAGSTADIGRANMISTGLSVFLDSPIFGNGTAFSFTLFGTYSHNNFVELLMNYGIIGFSIYYFRYIILFPRLVTLSRDGDIYAVWFLIFVLMQIVLGIAWVNYYERITQLLTIIAVGYSETMSQESISVKNTCKYLKNP